jgi:hypothetical protein
MYETEKEKVWSQKMDVPSSSQPIRLIFLIQNLISTNTLGNRDVKAVLK